MKAILVDATARTITAIQINHWTEIAPAIKAGLFSCPWTDQKGNTVYADDEGLINGRDPHFVEIAGYPEPLIGDILFLGSDKQGESKDCTLSVEDVEKIVSFKSLADVRGRLW